MGKIDHPLSAELTEPVVIGDEAYLSEDYARAEQERLWRKVWQVACRVEEVAEVGDYVVYDILGDTILVTRNAEGELSAFYNVCSHRGKKIAKGCGRAMQFRCSYHAWRYNLKGENIFVLDREDWADTVDQERLDLPKVKVDTWGGWVWINMDPDSVSLQEYLDPAAAMLNPFELDQMRYRWRKWCYVPCNWKVALEAFLEGYHVEGTHPQLLKFQTFSAWSKAQGIHSNSGYGAARGVASGKQMDKAFGNTLMRPGIGADPRVSIWELQDEVWRTTDGTSTQVFVDAARRLVDELPEDTPAGEVVAHWMASAKRDDAARGVIWPEVDPAHVAACGSSWHLFPNVNVIQGLNNAMYYRARPHGTDPNQCIFEVITLERYPEGQAPQTDWEYVDVVAQRDEWPPVLLQDFDNMVDVQLGLRSAGFRGAIPSPSQERKIAAFHRTLASYMGRGAPRPTGPTSSS